jgi:hypothetical protein
VISIAIMNHPLRAVQARRLAAECAPLDARIVVDPDPHGVRSPLRTSKLAWRAVAVGASHHVVLQDDVQLCRDFAAHLHRAVAQHPRHAIALYTHWQSPQNSYLVRRAVASGESWARLSAEDWTPTVGLVLPADLARALADYLGPVPDTEVDEDQFVARFCRERAVPIMATVPHLVDETDLPTLVPEHDSSSRATLFSGERVLPADHWSGSPSPWLPGPRAYVVELRDSRCVLRLIRPGTGEPSGHEYHWYWHDWCALIGADPAEVLGDGPGEGLQAEVWAAGYLLGRDAGDRSGADAEMLHDTMARWIRSGLSRADRERLGAQQRTLLTELAVLAVAHGRKKR